MDDKAATSNKRALTWVCGQSDKVKWQTKARWIRDGKFYTSSGVSAGMDMTLGFISDCFGEKLARELAHRAEYRWNDNWAEDEFATI